MSDIEKNPTFSDTTSVSTLSTPRGPKYITWIYKLDSFGVETRGIERVSGEERQRIAQSTSKYVQFGQVIGLWIAACGGLTSMSSYFLPTLLLGLNLRDALVSGLISMIIGCLIPAYCSTMGPKSGCRQMVTARFLFGQWGVKFVALIAIVGGIGWSVVNCVLGGQMLVAINGNISLAVGIVVISIVSLIVAIFGIRVLLKFQTILAIPIIIACILFYVVVCQKMDYIHDSNEMIKQAGYSALTTRGNWLSFFAIGYSITATWGSGASDYYILFPENTPSYQIFLVTFFGISIPSTFVAIVGTLCGTIALSYKPWNDAYNTLGVGGLIVETFSPWGRFGKFVAVILYISLICNNIMNTYSIAFEFQLIGQYLLYIPRWVWAFIVTAIYIVLSLAGKEHFSTILSNFLPMLGYWISMYIVLLLEENLIFRSTITSRKMHESEYSGGNYDMLYNWNNWNKPKGLTRGVACALAFACGVAGAVIGMNQVYYQGPLAKKIGDYGGDLGMWLSFGFTGITYPVFRYFELKQFKK
ncbi:uncharacterized protein SPAPADRAFT_147865 [Spathaspora passalidarum NRRL Y-27907]|uniref:Vitamin B6 transporter n=1 Tax=Spathaspora passalidarum (strain NRRL Y-27907 / 11-Y1) TaxID=619300 RepID=G3AIY3_SPAPN|nr:uncharacterized protein SPAPADRAFT_147865 [Spathaspora passalidarum NRRL Y-27907]EGW33794.1 hypothetical protein SPAPADRAFT_147865 [Spathaspora passalidarum NRRL Y-27907]